MNEITVADKLGVNYHSERVGSSVGRAAWHSLAAAASKREYADGADLMADLGLDWKVEKQPLFGPQGQETGFSGVFRSDTGACLGSVGKRWTEIQNDEAIGDLVVDLARVEPDLSITGGGVLGQGEGVWVVASMGDVEIGAPGRMLRNGEADLLTRNVLFTLKHDGKGALRMVPIPEQVWCANQLAGLLSTNGKNGFSIAHTKNFADRLAVARQGILAMRGHYADLIDELRTLDEERMTRRECFDFAERLIAETREAIDGAKDAKTEAGKRKRQEDAAAITRTFFDGASNTGRTKLDALSAVTDWLSYQRGRAKKAGEDTQAALSRLNDDWFGGNTIATRRRALRLLRGGGVE